MEDNEYHQISAFAVAKAEGSNANAAYSVYDINDQLVVMCVSMPNTSEHRALIMAFWSAVRYCKEHLPSEEISVYTTNKEVANEITKVWYAENAPKDFADGDRILSTLIDSCYVKSVSFGYVGLNEDGAVKEYSGRMKELYDLICVEKN